MSAETIVFAIIIGIILCIMTVMLFRMSRQLDAKNREECTRKNVEHHKMIALINNITDAIFSTDEHGIITSYNSAALNLIDTNRSIEGVHISEVLTLETVDKTPFEIFKELSKSAAIRQRDDLIMPFEDGDQMRLDVTLAPVQGGDKMTPDGYVIILRDITKVKSLEEERDEFISVVSHELRTPITIAEGSLSNAQLLIKKGVKNKVAEALEESHKQVLFLAKMVNDLSTLSRAERGVADEPEMIDIAELATQLNSEYSTQASQRGLAFNLDVSGAIGHIQTSRLYLQELLQNFLDNAIKYTQKGSVTLSIKKQKDGSVLFKVKDTGIGINKVDLAKIFDRFYRAEDYRTRETSGTGLGLYVAAKLARKLNAKIEVNSRLNHGSTFSFSLKPLKNTNNLQKK